MNMGQILRVGQQYTRENIGRTRRRDYPDFRCPTEALERRSSPGSTWKSITHTPPDLSTPTPSATAPETSAERTTGPMPMAPWASANLAMLGGGASSRN